MRKVFIVYSNGRTFKVIVAESADEARQIAGYGEVYQVSLTSSGVVEVGNLD